MKDFKELANQWKTELNKEVDTTDLQILALEYFLNNIGWCFRQDEKTGVWHITKHDKELGVVFMSFNEAVSLYNPAGNIFKAKDHNITLCSKQVFDKAWNERILDTIYLQRKGGEFVAQKMMIKFNTPEVIDPLEGY